MTRALVALVLSATAAAGCTERIELDPTGSSATCAAIGQSCAHSADCCSHACADDGTGSRTCQSLGGCLEPHEACDANGDCCGGVCEPPTAGATHGRCAMTSTCAAVGEICRAGGDPTATLECCSSGMPVQCHPTGVGIDRCRVNGMGACLGEGAACRSPEDCCSDVCVLGAGGTLACAVGCRATDQSCSRSADCCDGTCRDGACIGTRSCTPLGGACAQSADCCSETCSGDTCQLPPS